MTKYFQFRPVSSSQSLVLLYLIDIIVDILSYEVFSTEGDSITDDGIFSVSSG